MKDKAFFDAEHAARYLVGSVIRMRGRPITVDEIFGEGADGKLHVMCSPSDADAAPRLVVLGEQMDMNPVPLGMYTSKVGVANYTHYLTRAPARMWKVGLDPRNLMISTISNKRHCSVNSAGVIASKEFEDTVLGKYCAFEKALKIVADKNWQHEVAVSRRFALDSKGVYYKALGIPVGSIQDGKIVLLDKFDYLKEVLKEDLPNACD